MRKGKGRGEAVTSRRHREDERWWLAEEWGGKGGDDGGGVKMAADTVGATRAAWCGKGDWGNVALLGAAGTTSA
ncbi:unnamed protein product [Linum trigynum]|uniref:Uncharacterized protein n=1 Tax=Linum trigynum TaxID=586398 RepID=A0AAV2CXP4_9ROSI